MTIDRPRRGSPAAMVVLGLVALGLSGWVVLNSAFFAIDDVRIEGVRNVASEDIRELAGVSAGENLIMLAVDDVARRVEGHPWVLDARVERDFPTTAVITVIERRPGGWIEDPGGIVIVAGDGTVLERTQTKPPNLPSVGHGLQTLTAGDRVPSSSELLRVAASMGEPLRRQIESLELQGTELVLDLRQGGTVLYGGVENLPAKNRALAEMLRWARGEGIAVRTVDVRVPSAPSLAPLEIPADPAPTPSP